MDADGNVYLDSEQFLSTLAELLSPQQVSKIREAFYLPEVEIPRFPENEFISKEDDKKKVPAEQILIRTWITHYGSLTTPVSHQDG